MSEGLRRYWSWTGFWMIVLGKVLFVLVAADVVWHGRLWQLDKPIHIAIYQWADASSWRPVLDLPFGVLCCAGVSGLGDFRVATFVCVTVLVMLLFRKRWRTAAVWVMAFIGSAIINPALKAWFLVPRPMDHTFFGFKPGPDTGWSFPSGHTMAVSVTAGALVMVLLREGELSRGWRRAFVAAAILLSVLEAFALMYVGVHYLTDVLGGLFASLAWLGVARWLLPPAPHAPPRRRADEPLKL